MSDAAAVPGFFVPVPCAVGEVVTLGPEQSAHMVVVLRVRPGESVRLFTGRGEQFLGRVELADPSHAEVRICARCAGAPGPGAPLIVGFAPPPAQRADFLIEKATELGAAVLQPVVCERLQAFQAESARERRARWQRKAEDAARQSQRASVPEVRAPVLVEEFVRSVPAGLRLLGQADAACPLWSALQGAPDVPAAVVLVGPAGGFTRRETDFAREAGFTAVSLGPSVLRVETAVLAMLSCIAAWLAGRHGTERPS